MAGTRLLAHVFVGLLLPTCFVAAQDVIAVRNVTVIPMIGEKVLSDHTVVVRQRKVVHVGPSSTVSIPPDAQIIDGTGKYLIPGLIDMHVHVRFDDEITQFLAHGVTTLRNMSGYPNHRRLKKEIARGERLGPAIYSAARTIDGFPKPPWIPGTLEVKTAEQAEQAVERALDEGWDFIKVYDSLNRECYDAIIRSAKVPVVGHVPMRVGLEAVLSSKQRSIEHLFGYEAWLQTGGPIQVRSLPERTRAWLTLDPTRINKAAKLTVDAGVWNCPTCVLFAQMRPLESFEQELKRDDYQYVSTAQIKVWRERTTRLGVAIPHIRQGIPNRMRLLKALHASGARIVAGTDTGMPLVPPGLALHWELEHFVQAGFTPLEALRTATASAAACLGKDDIGVIKSGNQADLLLLGRDPLKEIKNVSKIEGVMIRGRWLSRKTMDGMLQPLIRED